MEKDIQASSRAQGLQPACDYHTLTWAEDQGLSNIWEKSNMTDRGWNKQTEFKGKIMQEVDI